MTENNVLDLLSNNRIFSTELTEDKTQVSFVEMCDEHYKVKLNRKQVFKLCNEFIELYDNMSVINVPKE